LLKQAQGTQGIVLVSHCLQTNKHPLALRSPIQKELVKFFMCEFRLIFRHNCVEEGLSFSETRRVRVLEAFLMLNPVLFLLFSFLQQTRGGFSKLKR
jgi:hypothetical protein